MPTQKCWNASRAGLGLGADLSRRQGPQPITSLGSGVVVAWSTFMQSIYEGVTDIFINTYHIKRQQGALGGGGGDVKEIASLTLKTGSAIMGLITCPKSGVLSESRESC